MEMVFVYGTLRHGEQYHHLLSGSRLFSLLARTRGNMFDTGRDYPILTEGGRWTAGEVYEVTEDIMARLDELEEYYGPGDRRNEYERVRTEVITEQGPIEAWAYIYPHSHEYPSVPAGDWKLYRLRREEGGTAGI